MFKQVVIPQLTRKCVLAIKRAIIEEKQTAAGIAGDVEMPHILL